MRIEIKYPRERAVKGRKFATQNSVRGFLNRRFKLSFWSLLGQRPKVTRAGARNTPSRSEARKTIEKETHYVSIQSPF